MTTKHRKGLAGTKSQDVGMPSRIGVGEGHGYWPRLIRLLTTMPSARNRDQVLDCLSQVLCDEESFKRYLAILSDLGCDTAESKTSALLDATLKQKIVRDGLDQAEVTNEVLNRLLFSPNQLENLFQSIRCDPKSFAYGEIEMELSHRLNESVRESEAWVSEAVGRALQAAAKRDPAKRTRFDPEAVCKKAMKDLGAKSIIVYLDDSEYRGDFRVVCMPGVEYPEVMHGFLGRPDESAKKLITCGIPEQYVPHIEVDEEVSDELSAVIAKLDPPKRRLFAGFVPREGVRSRAQLVYQENGRPRLALFVNFARGGEFPEEKKRRIRELFWELVEHLPAMTEQLNADRGQYRQIARIWASTHQLTAPSVSDKASLRECVGECMDGILDTVLDAFDIREDGLATIHLYHRETGTLHLFASRGRIDRVADTLAHSVHDPDRPGVITVAALKGKAILIDDLRTSKYRLIQRRIRIGSRSELAIPMVAGEVVGVINLESTRPRAFTRDSVRVLWSAANKAALAVCHYRERAARRKSEEFRDQLLGWYQRAAEQPGEALLDNLAAIACSCLEASQCHLWQYDPRTKRFTIVASTDPERSTAGEPRTGLKKGWSDYVRRTGWPVWISNAKDERRFDALYWNKNRWQGQPPAATNPPETINPHMLHVGVECELGVPIRVGNRCTGVAWLKYQDVVQQFSEDDMIRAAGLAAMVLYKNGKGPLMTLSEETMSLACEFSGQVAKRMPCAPC